jgi:hypothetical protein
MVESVFGFCTQTEYDNFMKGVKGFEKDLVRQGTIIVYGRDEAISMEKMFKFSAK